MKILNQPSTIKDIAAALSMSHSTVSRALNGKAQISEETKRRVREAAARLGYIPNHSARMIRGDAGMQVGLLIPDVQNDFFANIAKVLADLCRGAGLRLLLGITDDDPATEESEIRGLLEARVGGILATLSSKPTQASLQLLKTTVCVQLTARIRAVPGAAVCLADEAGCREATEHLLHLGHRKVGYLGLPTDTRFGRDRLKGYRRAHAHYGVEPLAHGVELAPAHQEEGVNGTQRLLALVDRPTAILAASSELTLGALKAIQAARLRIPADLSLVGYGDPRWSELLTPPMTTVRLPVATLAADAAQELFRRLAKDQNDAGKVPAMRRLPTELIVRGSTAPPRQAGRTSRRREAERSTEADIA